MSDETPAAVAAARALVAAYDALSSDEHKAEAEKLRELSKRVNDRVEAFQSAQAAIQQVHVAQVASGEAPAADNQQAAYAFARYFNGNHPVLSADDEGMDLEDLVQSYDARDDEHSTAKANGAYSED